MMANGVKLCINSDNPLSDRETHYRLLNIGHDIGRNCCPVVESIIYNLAGNEQLA